MKFKKASAASHDLCNISEVVRHCKQSFDAAFKLRVIRRAEVSSNSAKLNIHDDGNSITAIFIVFFFLNSKLFA